MLLGIVALITLPREEEPQISVPMVDIHVRADGLRAEDAVKLVTEPLETIVKSIPGVEHVYSRTQDDGVLVTARFEVGTSSDAAIVRVHEKVRANIDRIPGGIPEPMIVGRGIDDVAIKVVTLAPRAEAADRWTPSDLTRVAQEVQVAIAVLPEIGLTYIVGETPEEIRIRPDPDRLAQAGLTLQALAAKVEGANRSFSVGTLREDGRQIGLAAGRTLADLTEIGNLLVTTRDGRPVYVRDVADVTLATDTTEARVFQMDRADAGFSRVPAVSLAIAKRPGANAVTIGEEIRHAVERLEGTFRDMGAAFGVALVGIYILLVMQFGSFKLPLVVLTPVPLTLIGILLGHWLFGAPFSATSMIGFIALAGIIVRNSILLVDFIRHSQGDGRPLLDVLLEAGSIRFNRILVTALAAMSPIGKAEAFAKFWAAPKP